MRYSIENKTTSQTIFFDEFTSRINIKNKIFFYANIYPYKKDATIYAQACNLKEIKFSCQFDLYASERSLQDFFKSASKIQEDNLGVSSYNLNIGAFKGEAYILNYNFTVETRGLLGSDQFQSSASFSFLGLDTEDISKAPASVVEDEEEKEKEKVIFKLKILDETDKNRYAGLPFSLSVGPYFKTGKVQDGGVIELEVDRSCRLGELVIYQKNYALPADGTIGQYQDENVLLFYNLVIAKSLPDPSSILGIQTRLKKLGFLSGLVTNTQDEAMTTAIKEFQKKLGVSNPDGQINDDIINKIKNQHGS